MSIAASCSQGRNRPILREKKIPELENENWNNHLYIFCNITGHLNEFSLDVHGKNQLIFHIIASAKAFKMKLGLFKSQMSKGRMCHFRTCMQQIPLCKRANLGKYSKNMELLSQVFDGRLNCPRTTLNSN
jgi:hypothetical protein